MILLEHPLSSCMQEVTTALREKGVLFERQFPSWPG
jgi:hypothetical protein